MKKKRIMVIGVILIISFCININLSTKSESDIKNSKTKTDKQLAIYVAADNGEYKPSTLTSFPKKEDGYVFKEGVCNNGGIITQNEDESFNLSVSSTDQCKLYFDKTLVKTLLNKANGEGITDYNNELGNKGEMYTFKHEATEQTGVLTDYRYIGANPNNWIKFNGEDWRIIGVFPVKNENGQIEQRVKIMRNISLENMAWNKEISNNWVNSTSKIYLNDTYYNNLTSVAKKQISKSSWYLGAYNDIQLNGETFYRYERSNIVGASENSVKVASLNIGLLYSSDYLYTYVNDVDKTCYNNGYKCQSSFGGNPTSGWIYKDIFNKQHNWLLSPNSIITKGSYFVNKTDGYIGGHEITLEFGLNPVVYLKPDIKETGGDGSENNPYTLEEPLVEKLLDKVNDASVTTYVADSEQAKQMYIFNHDVTEQTGALRDYRFIGTNPNNWIKFNDEDWRIIGVFTVDGEQRVKIMRNESIGIMSWNSNGTNNWEGSSLETLLNRGDYYNRTGNYASIGLTKLAKTQIEASIWYLGTSNNVHQNYNIERSNNTAKAENSVKNIKSFVGLIYPSDYIFTYGKGISETCLNNAYSVLIKMEHG